MKICMTSVPHRENRKCKDPEVEMGLAERPLRREKNGVQGGGGWRLRVEKEGLGLEDSESCKP